MLKKTNFRIMNLIIGLMLVVAFTACGSSGDSDNNGNSGNSGNSGGGSSNIQDSATAKALAVAVRWALDDLDNNIPVGDYSGGYSLSGVTVTGEKTESSSSYSTGGYDSERTNIQLNFSNFTYSNLTITSGSGWYSYSYSYDYRTSPYYVSSTKKSVSYDLYSCQFSFVYNGKTYRGTVTIDYNTYGASESGYGATIDFSDGQSFSISYWY